MSFGWPWLLTLLAAPALMVVAYLWWLRRRRRAAVRFTHMALVREAVGQQPQWRRHLPFALLVLAATGLILASTRPQAIVQVPLSQTSIILTMDVSRSMCATDIEPNRLTVAQAAATAFIRSQAGGTQIGLVAFAGFTELVVPPTRDTEVLVKAVEDFSTSFGTVSGSATLKAVNAIAEINPDVQPIDRIDPTLLDTRAPGEFVSDIIVLLTDGATLGGVDPLFAANLAADRGVRVYTIGFGTSEPTEMVCNPQQSGTSALGEFGSTAFSGAPRRFLVIDEPTLRGMAAITGGEYFRAENADQLVDVFTELPTRVELQDEEQEISVFFVMGATLLALAAVATSIRFHRR
jgi:Ca-activated chloride channel family protein